MKPSESDLEEDLALAMSAWKAMEARLKERLAQAGMRVTDQRRSMLRALSRSEQPLTAEEVFERIKKATGDPGELMDVGTLYRSLVALEAVQLVRRVDLGDGVNRYEYDDGGMHHHFLVCRKCSKRERLNICPMGVLHQMATQLGYANLSHVASVFGECADCQTKG